MNQVDIKNSIITFLKKGNPLLKKEKLIPHNKSLLQLGLIDSFAFLELVEFIEKKFNVKISDNEITPENFGSLNLMSKLIYSKISKK